MTDKFQTEIDELLKNAIDDSEETETSQVTKATKDKDSTTGKAKTYKCRKDNYLRYGDVYKSPIVKRENYILNPNPKQPESEDQIIVRSLDNWNEYYMSQKKKIKSTFF